MDFPLTVFACLGGANRSRPGRRTSCPASNVFQRTKVIFTEASEVMVDRRGDTSPPCWPISLASWGGGRARPPHFRYRRHRWTRLSARPRPRLPAVKAEPDKPGQAGRVPAKCEYLALAPERIGHTQLSSRLPESALVEPRDEQNASMATSHTPNPGASVDPSGLTSAGGHPIREYSWDEIIGLTHAVAVRLRDYPAPTAIVAVLRGGRSRRSSCRISSMSRAFLASESRRMQPSSRVRTGVRPVLRVSLGSSSSTPTVSYSSTMSSTLDAPFLRPAQLSVLCVIRFRCSLPARSGIPLIPMAMSRSLCAPLMSSLIRCTLGSDSRGSQVRAWLVTDRDYASMPLTDSAGARPLSQSPHSSPTPPASHQARLRVYLAGKVSKSDRDGDHADWRAEYAQALSAAGDFCFLDPSDPDLDEGQPELVFGHDCYLLKTADIVIVNAEHKLGAGTAQEMVIARYFGKPVYTILPPDSHHRRSNLQLHGRVVADWQHPFVVCTSLRTFDSLTAMCAFLRRLPDAIAPPPPSLEFVDAAIAAYVAVSGQVPPRPAPSGPPPSWAADR